MNNKAQGTFRLASQLRFGASGGVELGGRDRVAESCDVHSLPHPGVSVNARFVAALALLPSLVVSSPLNHDYYVLRHGQSLANVAGVISSDPRKAVIEHGLSETGKAQADAAASQIASEASQYQGVVIVASDLRRAWQTASIVRAHLVAAGVNVWPANGVLEHRMLRERSFGKLSGQSDDKYNDVWEFDKESATHHEFGCESVESVVERARHVVDELEHCEALQPSNGGKRWMVVLVAHGDVLQIAQTAFADVDPRTHRSLEHLETATLRKLHAPRWHESDGSKIGREWLKAKAWPPAGAVYLCGTPVSYRA